VPFYIRAGKNLAVTCTELMVRLKRPPAVFAADGLRPNHFRFRISPDVEIAHSLIVKSPDADMSGEPVELMAMEGHRPNEMDAYERVLHDATIGDSTLFAREDYVEEAWRIIDPVLKSSTPVYEYDRGMWGPGQRGPAAHSAGRLERSGDPETDAGGTRGMNIEVCNTGKFRSRSSGQDN
jgi:glucose-6-phosphate 1-dehydrogenase